MERLQERLENANRALAAFHEVVVNDNPSTILDIGSPKGVVRSFREVGVFSEDETILALQMTDDRNLTIHTYNEELEIEIHGRLPDYYNLLSDWIDRLKAKIA